MTRARAAILIGCLVPLAALAATPRGEVEAGAVRAEVRARGATQPQLRIAAGGHAAIRVEGPATVRLGIAVERGLVRRAVSAIVDVDGKLVSEPRPPSTLQQDAVSDRGFALSEAVSLEVPVAAGSDRLQIRWPADAPADLLVSVEGLALSYTLDSVASLLPLPAPAAAKGAKPAALPLPAPPLPPPAPVALAVPAAAQPSPPPAAKPASAMASSMLGAPPAQRGGMYRSEPGAWSFMLIGGAESTSQNYLPTSAAAHLGLEATQTAFGAPLFLVQFDWRFSQQTYASGQPSSTPDRVPVDEQRIDVLLGVGYDLGQLLGIDGLTLAPVIGFKYLRLDNRAFPADLLGFDLAGRARYALARNVALHANVGWMYNLAHPARFSALGTPLGQLGVRAGLDFPLGAGYALALDYSGDVLAFDYSYRVAHGASVGFGRTF